MVSRSGAHGFLVPRHPGRHCSRDRRRHHHSKITMNPDFALPSGIAGFALVLFLVWLFNCLNILREYERAVVFRLGRVLKREKGPGLVLILWPIDKIVKVSLRVVTWDVPAQDIITRDNVSLKVNAVVYYRVTSATKAIVEVENFRYAVEQAAQTGLRSVLGEVELDDLLAQREKLNARLQTILDEHTEAWGVKVTQVQVKQVDLPQEIQRAIRGACCGDSEHSQGGARRRRRRRRGGRASSRSDRVRVPHDHHREIVESAASRYVPGASLVAKPSSTRS